MFAVDHVTVANGQSVSAVINTDGRRLVGIYVPAGVEGAYILLKGGIDGANFGALATPDGSVYGFAHGAQPLYVDFCGGDITGAVGTYPKATDGIRCPYITLTTYTDDPEGTVNQSGDAVFGLIFAKD